MVWNFRDQNTKKHARMKLSIKKKINLDGQCTKNEKSLTTFSTTIDRLVTWEYHELLDKQPDLFVHDLAFAGKVLGPPGTHGILEIANQADPDGCIGIVRVRSLAALRWDVHAVTKASLLTIWWQSHMGAWARQVIVKLYGSLYIRWDNNYLMCRKRYSFAQTPTGMLTIASDVGSGALHKSNHNITTTDKSQIHCERKCRNRYRGVAL